MQPTPGDVHVNAPLTNVSVAFIQSTEAFIASRVFPNIPVQKQSDRYYTYDRGEFNRNEAKERAPATESEGGGYTLDNTPTYFCTEYGYHKDIPDQVRANADAAVNPDREATLYVTHKALLQREVKWVSKFFAGSIWTHDKDGVASGEDNSATFRQWNDVASDPIGNIRLAKRTVLESTGFEPNKLVLGRAVYDALCDHPDIVDRIKYGQTAGSPAKVNRATMATLFEVEEILVMNAIQNTAKEGVAAAHSFIGGKKALLCYAPPAPGLMTPTAGYTFSWNGMYGMGMDGNRIRTFRMEPLKADRVEIDFCYDMKVISADLGYFWDTIVA